MIKKSIQKIGASENKILKVVATFMRLPIEIAQSQLLNIQKDRNIVDLIKKVQKGKSFTMWPAEMVQLYSCVYSAKKLPGDFAEVGVYTGKSAKLICEVKGEKTLHLFDTFEGLPAPEYVDGDVLHQKQYVAKLDLVKKYLSSYKNLAFYPGVFPETSEPVKNKTFAFVHLDVDLYRGTLECLKFFYPRMVKGGVILSHDYSTLPGVKKAFSEFFAEKTELVLELSTSQCLIVKL